MDEDLLDFLEFALSDDSMTYDVNDAACERIINGNTMHTIELAPNLASVSSDSDATDASDQGDSTDNDTESTNAVPRSYRMASDQQHVQPVVALDDPESHVTMTSEGPMVDARSVSQPMHNTPVPEAWNMGPVVREEVLHPQPPSTALRHRMDPNNRFQGNHKKGKKKAPTTPIKVSKVRKTKSKHKNSHQTLYEDHQGDHFPPGPGTLTASGPQFKAPPMDKMPAQDPVLVQGAVRNAHPQETSPKLQDHYGHIDPRIHHENLMQCKSLKNLVAIVHERDVVFGTGGKQTIERYGHRQQTVLQV